jgi:hypothetical protein
METRFVRCGRPNCHCAKGQGHGPYTYLIVGDRAHKRKKYVRKGETAEVQTRFTSHREQAAKGRASRDRDVNLLRSMRDEVREVQSKIGVMRRRTAEQ